MTSSELIVLRKIPYKESSLIISGLTPEYGKLDFNIRGARKYSKKKFPAIDLFREISVEFEPQKHGLQTIYKADLLTYFDNISTMPGNFMQACQIAEFIIRNTKSMMKSEALYGALKNALEKLSKAPSEFQFSAVKLVYLYENGYLPDNLSASPGKEAGEREKKLIKSIVDYALGGNKPELNAQYWKKFSEWIDVVCRYHELI